MVSLRPYNSDPGIPFAELPSPVRPVAASSARRADPFFGRMWASGTGGQQLSWLSYDQAVESERVGTYRMSAKDSAWKPSEALDYMLGHHDRTMALATLGAAFGWHVATEQQVAAIVGYNRVQPFNEMGRAMWVAGLLQRGRFVADAWERSHRLPMAWRQNPAAPVDRLFSEIRYREWLGVTGGQPWRAPNLLGRHGMLATELSLRVAEFCHSVAAVYGERFSGWGTVLPPSCVPVPTERTADATWVREDGLRIIVEIMASRAPSTFLKAGRWVDALARDRNREVFLLFVDASMDAEADSSARNAVLRYMRQSLDASLAGVDDRIAFTKWRDWFPKSGVLTEDFLSLRCRTANMEPISLLDPFCATFGGTTRPGVDNASLIYSVPKWQRARLPTPNLEPLIRHAAGLKQRQPVVQRTERLHRYQKRYAEAGSEPRSCLGSSS